MARIASAKKRIRVAEKRQLRNKTIRSTTRTYVKKAEATILGNELTGAAEATRQAVSLLDRAASKGILHRNAVARRKSRLMKKLNTALAAQT
ncbi:MAG: 30S ribosomal protein S20 [Chloroflexi bacterium]|nr:30S ribosomal protein S20 [Chloroflexota bacterium]